MGLHVHFNDNDFGAIPYTSVRNRQVHDRPKRINTRYKLARRPGTKLVNTEDGEKEILLMGEIAAPSRTLMETSLRILKSHLEPVSGRLELEEAGALVRYYATMESIIHSAAKGGYMPWTLKFIADDPYGYDAASTALTITSPITTATASLATTFAGLFRAFPVLTLTVSSLTGGTGTYIKITNPATGDFVQVTRNWIAGDVLVIDTKNRTVKVNGVAVDFTGSIPSWAAGAGTIDYADGFSARSVAIAGTFVKRYL